MKMCRMRVRDVCKGKKKKEKTSIQDMHALLREMQKIVNLQRSTKCCDVASSMQGKMSIPGSCRSPS